MLIQKIRDQLCFYLSISASGRKFLTVRRVPDHVDESVMLLDGALPFEGRSLEETNRIVFAAHNCSERSRRLEVNRIDRLRCAHDLARASACLGIEHMTKPLTDKELVGVMAF